MILVLLILVPLAGGALAWIFGKRQPLFARYVSLMALLVDLGLALVLWNRYFDQVSLMQQGAWLEEYQTQWIPQLGVTVYLAVDGLSLLLIVLTAFLGAISVAASWSEVRTRVGFFHFNLLAITAGLIGVFLAIDLFLFYFFWEVMLIPMYFMIGIWGHEDRIYASMKFFIFTQASGLLMLLAILGLYYVHHEQTGVYTFNYMELLGTSVSPGTGWLLMSGFFAAFAVKLPMFPFHTWLPDAHTEAPTAGSVILAGLMLKSGAYGMLRFVIPLFPEAAREFAPAAMALGVIGILYGAVMAFAQDDLKRLIAYTSVSHLGFVLLGIFAWNTLAMQGAVMQMLCHGFSTGALFVLVGLIQEEIHTRDMRQMGGLWDKVPRMGAVAMFFAMASLGLPGLGNFVAEILILIGAYRSHPVLTAIATTGFVAATVYSLWIIQKVFHGKPQREWNLPDLAPRHMVVFGSMIVVLLWLGLYPKPVIETARTSIEQLQRITSSHAGAGANADVPVRGEGTQQGGGE
jgi:NADH-quinone oxidoreductase subunit M